MATLVNSRPVSMPLNLSNYNDSTYIHVHKFVSIKCSRHMQRRNEGRYKDANTDRDEFNEAMQELINDPDSGIKEFMDR